jgi:hypothetical protein
MVRICRIPEALLVVESAPGETAIDYIALGYIWAICKTFHSGPPHLLESDNVYHQGPCTRNDAFNRVSGSLIEGCQ